jgi:hypothetical protein
MNGYNYSPVTGEYLGSVELRESPLEPGVPLVPACCATIAPPEAQQGFAACWTGDCWELVADHRGEAGSINGAAFVISGLGAHPDGWSATPPAPEPNEALDAQILALEATVTQRRLREAAITEAGKAWLADLDAQIAALRAQRT